MPEGIITVAYILSGALFILSLRGLSHQETARNGNLYGILGMIIAVSATLFAGNTDTLWILIAVMITGGVIGLVVARRVAMTEMPELVAILHSFVGASAVLVGIVSHLEQETKIGSELIIHQIEIVLGVFIGAYTFTGSIIAFLKLRGSISGKPLTLPIRHQLDLLMLLSAVICGFWFVSDTQQQLTAVLAITFIAGLLGIHMIMAIGGADMPVVVSMLNSYSGWAAAAAGVPPRPRSPKRAAAQPSVPRRSIRPPPTPRSDACQARRRAPTAGAASSCVWCRPWRRVPLAGRAMAG